MSKLSNEEYWLERAAEKITDYEKKLERLEKTMRKEFDKTYESIESDIADLYFRYADESGISYEDAVKYLNDKERKDFQTTLEEYIQKANDSEYRKEHIRELKAMSTRARIQRLEALKTNIKQNVNELYNGYVKKNTQVTFDNVMRESYYKTIFDIQKFQGFGVSFDMISDNTLESLLEYPWSGSNYSQKIWGHVDNLSDKLENILTTGIIQGKSTQRMAEELRKATDTSYKNAVRLVRTETNYISNQATAKAYEDYGVDEYQYLATLDLKTSQVCMDLDGKVFKSKDKIVGVNFPPMHPHCRSTTIPYFEDLDDDGGTRVARDNKGKTYKVDGKMTYQQWYDKYVEFPTDEARAATQYTSSTSYKINEKLRNNIKLDDDEKELVKNLDKALTKLPKYKGTVTRSLQFMYEEDRINFLKSHKKDDIIKYPSYTSTTIGSIYNPDGQVQIVINSKRGRRFTKFNPGEQEVLFKRNTSFLVNNVVDKGDYTMIIMEEV